ncbi:deoxyribonuclease II [Kipferlia bialata]|uniref:Deoxyribonuclease II n=1 Tax=Kipferlia bialata TaxID=797122 RepID=A0A9K3D3H5_9EUKA|nr:deoxyribonuclease II [Kipferlia bialata]|eukprot:g8497.t1
MSAEMPMYNLPEETIPAEAKPHRQFTCAMTTCEEVFSTLGLLMAHYKEVHDGLPHQCPAKNDDGTDCGMRFKTMDLLRTHLGTHTDPKPYHCPKCTRQFKRRSHLKRHIATHDTERRYLCPQCSKAFKREDHLKVHLKGHAQKREFPCPNCEKEFITKSGVAVDWWIVLKYDKQPKSCDEDVQAGYGYAYLDSVNTQHLINSAGTLKDTDTGAVSLTMRFIQERQAASESVGVGYYNDEEPDGSKDGYRLSWVTVVLSCLLFIIGGASLVVDLDNMADPEAGFSYGYSVIRTRTPELLFLAGLALLEIRAAVLKRGILKQVLRVSYNTYSTMTGRILTVDDLSFDTTDVMGKSGDKALSLSDRLEDRY